MEKNLTDLNYASINKFKFIDTMKYYQTSLGKLSETLTEKEKEKIAKLTIQFLLNHDYISTVSKDLSNNQQNKIIEIIVNYYYCKIIEIIVNYYNYCMDVIPYEKIETIDSLLIRPEDGIFFSKDEFFSTLIGKNVYN